MPQVEKDFLARINAKEEKAFRELFEMFYRYLVVYAVRYVQETETAEDVVQDVFVALWKSEKEYNSFHGFRAFLYESVRKRRRRTIMSWCGRKRCAVYSAWRKNCRKVAGGFSSNRLRGRRMRRLPLCSRFLWRP